MTRSAQAFGKRLQDFTGNRETKAYLAALGATDANQRVFIQAVQGLLKTRHEGNPVVCIAAAPDVAPKDECKSVTVLTL
jgi:hypothetical protein